jgi:phospholipid/cholesterol/gamma-HCH transport system permease protein
MAEWRGDSSILTFLVEVMELCSKSGIRVSKEGLPKGVQQLMDLATAVPKKEDARKSVTHEPFLSKIGSDTLRFVQSSGEMVSFIGAAFLAFIRLINSRARFRSFDLGIFLQDTGAQAVSTFPDLYLSKSLMIRLRN